jgi:hypothetical protein
MSILLAIGKSHEGRHARTLRDAMISALAGELGASPIVSEWDGSEIPWSGPHDVEWAGKRINATAPH